MQGPGQAGCQRPGKAGKREAGLHQPEHSDSPQHPARHWPCTRSMRPSLCPPRSSPREPVQGSPPPGPHPHSQPTACLLLELGAPTPAYFVLVDVNV